MTKKLVLPISANEAYHYHAGDQVIYNGKKYESLIDNNDIWSPDVYSKAWKQIDTERGE